MPFCEVLENNQIFLPSSTNHYLNPELDNCLDILGSDLDTSSLNLLIGSDTPIMETHPEDYSCQNRLVDSCPPYQYYHQSATGGCENPVNPGMKRETMDRKEQDLAEEILNEVQQTALSLDLPLDPTLWNSQQVLRWICCMQQRHQLPEIDPSQFSNCPGSQFTRLTKQDLTQRAAAGDVLFAQLSVWKNALRYKLFKDSPDCLNLPNRQPIEATSYNLSYNNTSLWCYRKREDSFSSSNSYSSVEGSPPPNQSMLELMQQDDINYFQTSSAPCAPLSQHPLPPSSLLQSCTSIPSPLPSCQPSQPIATSHFTTIETHTPCFTASAPISHSICPVPTSLHQPLRGRSTDYKSIERDPMSSDFDRPIHLWEFLLDLLETPDVYASCIRWLDRASGVFKIEDSVQVAKLWGRRKNRPAMNYDKLSRSVRQYYKKGIIVKTGDSKRLIYKFGPRYCPK